MFATIGIALEQQYVQPGAMYHHQKKLPVIMDCCKMKILMKKPSSTSTHSVTRARASTHQQSSTATKDTAPAGTPSRK